MAYSPANEKSYPAAWPYSYSFEALQSVIGAVCHWRASVGLPIIGLWVVHVWHPPVNRPWARDVSCSWYTHDSIESAQEKLKTSCIQNLPQLCISPTSTILDVGNETMFPIIGRYLTVILGLVRQAPQGSVAVPCVTPCIMNDPSPSCLTPLICKLLHSILVSL